MSYPAEYAADILAAHYPAVRAALEAARTAEPGSGPNRYAEALTALDGAVFGLSAIPGTCARCGGQIIPADEHENHWRHAPKPDPVTEFLNNDHDAAPAEGDPR